MKTKCMSCGGTMKKMQKGGVTRPIPGQKKPVTREYKITRAMTNGVKSPNLPPLDSKYTKKRSTGLILKDKSKLQEGIYKPTMQKGGFPITAKAAARKVAKGKGMMTYKYGTTDAPGTGNNKGDYVKFAKDQKSNPYGGKSLKGSRSRSVMQKGGVIKKMQNGGITKDGQKIKFPPIVKKEVIQKSAPTKKTAFEKRQDKKIERAKTKSAIASIEGEGSVKDKRNSRANRIATVLGTGRQKVSRTSSTSTTSNTNSGNTNVSSGSDSGSTSGSQSGSQSGSTSKSGSIAKVSGSGNSQNANETNNNSKNRRYQNGGMTKKFITRPTPKKRKTNTSSSLVIGSGNSSNNNSVNNNSNNRKIVITKKDNSVNKSINSRNRYQKGGSTSSVINSGNSNNRTTVNNNSNNTKIYKKKVDNSVNKSKGSRNTRKIGTYPYIFN